VKAVVVQQTMSSLLGRFTNNEITKQEVLTGCLLELLYNANSAAAAPTTALLLTAKAIALVVHEELHFADRCKLVYTCQVARQNWYLLLHSRAVQKGKDTALRHAYVPVHIHCASFTKCLVPLPRSPSKLQAFSGHWLLVYMFALVCHKVTPKFLHRVHIVTT